MANSIERMEFSHYTGYVSREHSVWTDTADSPEFAVSLLTAVSAHRTYMYHAMV